MHINSYERSVLEIYLHIDLHYLGARALVHSCTGCICEMNTNNLCTTHEKHVIEGSGLGI